MTKGETILAAIEEGATDDILLELENKPESEFVNSEIDTDLENTSVEPISPLQKITTSSNTSKNQKNRERHFNQKTLNMGDAYENFLISDDFFGNPLETTTSINEEKAKILLDKKLRGLGIEVEEIMMGKDVLQVGGEEGQVVPLTRGLENIIKSIWNKDEGYTNKDRTDIVNDVIQAQIELLTNPNSEKYNEHFDFDTYINAYQIAENTPTQPDTDFPYLNFKDLNLDEQVIHTYRVRNAIFENFWNSNKGKLTKIDIEQQLSIKNKEIADKIFTNANQESENFWYLATIEYDTMLKKAQEEILLNNKNFQAITKATDDVIYGLFSKDLEKKSIQEKRVEEFGSIVANNKVLSGIFKGKLNYQLATTSMIAGSNAAHYELETNILSDIENMSDDEMYEIPFEKMRRLESWKMPSKLAIPGKTGGYKVGDLKDILKGRIQFHQVKALNAFMESNERQEILASITSSDSQLWKDGKFNVTGDNWKEAVGEQGFNMLVNILGAGFPTFVMEAGGAYNEMLEGSAQVWAKSQGKDWESLDVDEKIQIYFDVIDQGKIDFGSAKDVGIASMFLENLSNYVFVTKGLKPLSEGLGDAWTLMMKSKYKHAINMAGQTVKQAGGEMTAVTVVETFTELLQDGFSQYKFSSSLGDPSYSWDQGINTALTTVLTAPVIVGAGKTVSTFTNKLISQVTRLNTAEEMRLALKNNRDQILEDFANDKITPKERDERLLIADAVDSGLLKEDRMIEDPQSAENVIRLEMEAQKKLKQHRELEAKKKELKNQLGKDYTDEMAQANDQELAILANEYFDFKKEQQKHRYLDNYRINQIVKAEEFNTGKTLDAKENPLSDKWDLSIVKDNESIERILESIGIKLPRKKDGTIDQRNLEEVFKNLFEKGANEMVLTPEIIKTFNPNYDGKGIVLISDENIEANIMKGDMFASTAVSHGIEHVLFNENYSSKEGITKLQNLQSGLDLLTKSSTDETVQKMNAFVKARMLQYKRIGVKEGSKTYLEEYFNAWGDISKAISLNPNINSETRKTIIQIGEEINNMLHPGEKSNFGFDNTIEFLGSRLPIGEIKTETYLSENGKDIIITPVAFSLAEEVSTKGDARSDMKLIDDNNPYSLNRSNDEIAAENKRIGDLIKKHKNFVHKDKVIQEKVRTEGVKKYQQDLLYNNWGAFKRLINRNYKRDHEMHSDLNEEFFIGEAMEQFVKATSTYDPEVSDAFGAYYFGEFQGGASIAQRRLAKIWDDMEMEFTQDIDDVNYKADDTTLDVMQIVEDYNERSVLRESIPGFEENTPAYDSWIAEQTKVMSDSNFDWVGFMTDDKALSKLDKKGKAFYKLLKKSFKDKTYKNYNHTQEYIDYIIKNAKLLYNQMDQTTMNMTYGEFTEVDPDADVSEKTGRLTVEGSRKKKQKEVKSDTAGNIPRRKLKWNEDVEAAFIERLLKLDEIAKLKRQGLSPSEIHKIVRVDMLQEATFSQMSKILFRDAMMQVVTSDEFKAENGIDKAETSRMALLIDKGVDVKFSLPNGKEQVINASMFTSQKFVEETGRLTRLVENYEDSNNWEDVIDIIQSDKTAPQEIKDWVSSMYNKGLVESAGEKRFKSFTVEYLRSIGKNKLADEFNEGGNIRFNKNAKDNMAKNAAVFTKIFGKEFMDAAGFEWMGYKSGNRYLNITQGVKKGSVKGDYRDNYESLIKDLKSIPEEDLPGNLTYEDLANVRMMNKMSGKKDTGIFKRLITILESDKTKAQKLKEIQESGLQADIDAANDANEKVFKTIITEIAEQVKDGNVDEVAILEMFKMQSNLVEGFRGMSRLDGYLVLNGSQKGINWKGEHMKPMSVVSSEIIELIQRYKTDPSIDLSSEIDLILSDYTQILGDPETFDVLDVYGKANIGGINRFASLSDAQLRGITNANGLNARGIQAEILRRKSIKTDIIKSKKKAEAIENINLKTTSGEIQGTTVMDFDLTVGESNNVVVATNPKTGKTKKLDGVGWAKDGDRLLKEGWTMDFSDFNKVTDGKPGPLMQKLKNQIAKYGVDNVHILTARAAESAPAIYDWLQSQGINLPLENIVGLGNSTGQAKADWIENNLILNGFNDIYFVDDHHENVEAVQNMFNEYPPGLLVDGGKSVLVNPLEYNDEGVKFSLSDTFNKVLEDTEGIKAEKVFSKAQGQIRGRTAGSWYDAIYSPSAYDFEMFTYKYMGKGELGEQQALFFKENLFDPYENAIQQIDKKKQQIRNDYKALIKELPQVKKNLKSNIEGTNYTVEQAVRVYTWSKNGIDIPGLSKRDQKMLIKVVQEDQQLIEFSDRLSTISQQKEGYVAPSEYWTVEGISYDLTEMTGQVGRAKALAVWKENVEQIFSEENKNKLRALYGNDHVEALEDMLYRMEYGRNRNKPGRIEQQWNKWVNNSVGAVMFFNMRSASLQTISAFNYIDWDNNNIVNASKAFANQPQYWKDFSYIFNSDYLKERRAGSKRTVNEAELAAHLKGKDNKAKAALAWLLEKGFTPTQIADSFAIAAGGAGFYRNQVKFYEKQGMSTKDAETQAFLDFRDKTEKGQQSSRADMISQQQAGGLGRLILAFKNTPMQYNRLIIKAAADLKNKRGDTKTHLSKIAYYSTVQNVIFNSLQTALFSALGDEDEWDTKKERVANGMIDSILGGMGLSGSVALTIKNGFIEYKRQKARGFKGDQTRTLIQFANMSPTIGSKLRKLYSGIKTEQLNQGAIEEMGFTLENPAFNSLAQVISATTNIPLDRAVQKAQNIILASKSETEAADRIALLLGWNPWDLGLETEARKVNVEVKKRKKEEKKEQRKIKQQEKKESEFNLKLLQGEEKQKREKREGKQVTCLVCKLPVAKGKKYCTVHEKKEQRQDGKQVQCKKIKNNGKRCGMKTTSKSGYCYYHD